MPLVKIYIVEGKSSKYKKAVMSSVHDAFVDAFEIDDNDRLQRIIEVPAEDFEFPEDKTSGFMIIEATLFPGRTKEQKQIAIQCICANLYDRVGVEPSDVFIVFNDIPLENWGIGGYQQGN
ncbi:MAG: tautomerase family protein [Clostridia bacterium]|nr:tautomerase family protein [Clostridia bacterium]